MDKQNYPYSIQIRRAKAELPSWGRRREYEVLDVIARVTDRYIYVLVDDAELAFTRKTGKPTKTNSLTRWRITSESLESLQVKPEEMDLADVYYVSSDRFLHNYGELKIYHAKARETQNRYYWVGKVKKSFPGICNTYIDKHRMTVAPTLRALMENLEKMFGAREQGIREGYEREMKILAQRREEINAYTSGSKKPEEAMPRSDKEANDKEIEV